MRVWCILSSYNRPKGLSRALNSILGQTHKNWKCLLMDDGSQFDVQVLCRDDRILLFPLNRPERVRLQIPGHIVGINAALDFLVQNKKGGIITYICDDDWFYPTWFQQVVSFFNAHSNCYVIYGKEMGLPYRAVGNPNAKGNLRFPSAGAARHPGEKIDHSQIAHKVECVEKGLRWPMKFPGDRFFFDALAKKYKFFPINTLASQKAFHPKALCLGRAWDVRLKTGLKGWRE